MKKTCLSIENTEIRLSTVYNAIHFRNEGTIYNVTNGCII